MESPKTKTGWFSQLSNRLKRTGDSEPEQAQLRLAIGVLLVGYFCLPWGSDESFSEVIASLPSLITIFYYSSALAIFVAIVYLLKTLNFTRLD